MAHGARMTFACILVRLLFLGGCEATLMRPPTVCSGSGSPAQGSSPSGYGPARSPWPPGLGPAPYSPSVQCRYFTVTGKCFRGAACPLVHAEGTGLGYLEASWLRPQAPAWGAGSGSGAGAPPWGTVWWPPQASAVASTGDDNSRLRGMDSASGDGQGLALTTTTTDLRPHGALTHTMLYNAHSTYGADPREHNPELWRAWVAPSGWDWYVPPHFKGPCAMILGEPFDPVRDGAVDGP